MTHRLYYDDAYITRFESTVTAQTELEGRPALALAATSFYPTGGGQPHDLGLLNGNPVVEVLAEDNNIWHIVEKLPDSEVLTGEIDWQRRFDFMRQLTGQHILSRAFEVVLDASTVGFHLTENSLTIDLDKADIPLHELDTVENLSNQIIAENRAVRAWFPSQEELAELTLRKVPEKVTGEVRVVEIQGFDVCACGGTHVRSAGEIGQIKIIRFEKRRGGTRLEFMCGQRSLEDYRQKNNLLLQLATDLTVGYWEVPDAFQRLQEENKTLSKELRQTKSQLLKLEADILWQAAVSGTGRRVIAEIMENRTVADVQGMVGQLIQKPNTVVLMAVPGEKAHVIFGASEDAGYDVRPLLKAALETLGTNRGGGRETLAQGGGFPATHEQLESILAYTKARVLRDE
jgi:alanyl-tRNA synthetase